MSQDPNSPRSGGLVPSQGIEWSFIWLAAGLAGLLIGASRIFLGVHYFSDVMGGYLVALFWLVQPWSFPKKELSF